MTDTEAWQKVADRYFSPEEQAQWAERMKHVPPAFDQSDYGAKWADLGTRIGNALPMDPAAPQAQAFLAEWKALLAPFTAVATPEMMVGTMKLYDRMGEWSGDMKPPFASEVWDFIKAAGQCGKA